MNKVVIFLLINILIFIAIRYLAIIGGFLAGLGASDHYKYFAYVLWFLLASQIIAILAWPNSKITTVGKGLSVTILVLLHIGSISGNIPTYLVPH